MESLSSTFKHDPINSATDIRLLELQPGHHGDPIRCSLRGVHIDQSGDFEALSYAWGSLNDLRTIECGQGRLQVTVSLDAALRHLRQPNKPRIIWADAVCIDQTNIPERNEQVARMRDIYARAKSTVIWLGDDTTGLGDINSYISDTYDMFPPAAIAALDAPGEGQQNMAQQVIESIFELRDQGKPNLADYDWDPMVKIFTRPWFTRRWIVQEVAYSREPKLMCGNLEISFEKLSSLATWLVLSGISAGIETMCEKEDITYSAAFRNLIVIRELRDSIRRPSSGSNSISASDGSLVDVIGGCRTFMCGDDRDLVFAVLGLANDCIGDAKFVNSRYFPKPDYALTTEQVYTRFALWELIDKQNLDIMSLCETSQPNSGSLTLPSWVPDLRGLRGVSHSITDMMEMFKAGGEHRTSVTLVDERTVELSGYVVDHVTELIPEDVLLPINVEPNALVRPDGRFPDRFPNWLKACEKLASGEQESMTDSRFQEFWRAMTRDCDAVGNRPPPDLSEAFKSYLRHVYSLVGKHPREIDAQSVFEHLASVEPQVTRVAGYRFCRTKEDRLGQVSRPARQGDVVCIFPGAQVPYVLRPTSSGIYMLVGECYLNDVMDGQVITSGLYKERKILIQ